ncbi:non-ribosomal peptide synthetase [Paenibacillus amylolyticus]|nr:non-ribosomal peptide synthetase [Paenibacillus amylolyticus]
MNYLSKENVSEVLELSHIQKEYLQQHAVNQLVFELPLNIDRSQIQRTWDTLVEDSPALRTIFRSLKNRTVQVVLKSIPIELHWMDREAVSLADQQVEIELVAKEYRGEFLISEEPLHRVAILTFGQARTVLIWTFNVLSIDMYSCELLFDKWMVQAKAIQDKDLRYGDIKSYLQWEAEQDGKPAQDYWSDKMGQYSFSALQVPETQSSSENQSIYKKMNADLPEDLVDLIKECSRQHNTSLNSIVYSAWLLALHVYTGDVNVACGSTLTADLETFPTTDGMIGSFSHSLPIQVRLDSSQKCIDVIQDVEYQLKSIRTFGSTTVTMVKNNTSSQQDRLLFDTNLTINHDRSIEKSHGVLFKESQSFLEIFITMGTKWNIEFHNSSGASLEQLEHIMLHFQTILRSVVVGMNHCLDTLTLLPETERKRLVHDFNQSNIAPFSVSHTVNEIIEEQVRRYPDKIAVVCNEKSLTYQEINDRANRLAGWLRDQHLKPDDLVGIWADRSIEMLTSIVAVMKAGGAYVPLDISYPDKRLQHIVENGNISIMLIDHQAKSRYFDVFQDSSERPKFLTIQTVVETIEGDHPLYRFPTDNLNVIHTNNNLANVFFTSGSTGQPKGAMIEHEGMLNHLYAKINLLGLNEESIVAQNASHCFDISVWQFLAPLMVGGQVIIYPNEVAMDPLRLLESVCTYQVNVLEMVPAISELFLQSATENQFKLEHLHYMISTGEGLSVPLLQRWQSSYPDVKVVNTYGATECSDDTSHIVIDKNYHHNDHYVELGKPIPNMKHYVLDSWKRMVPIGCNGEIYISGIGVGRGYLNDIERTGAAFFSYKLHGEDMQKFYKTGDLGRYTPEGRLMFISRSDFQVKIRGLRIELGEIESVLLKHDEVRQVIVVAEARDHGEHEIAAYLVLNSNISEKELRDYMGALLPVYMIPQRMMILEEMPLNQNGKIDRKALPLIGDNSFSEEHYVAPEGYWENTVTKIWFDVLGLERISVEAPFFSLGGNSLKTIQVRSRFKQHLGIDVSIKSLFEHQTIRKLAIFLNQTSTTEGHEQQSIEKLEPATSYAMSNAQHRLYFLNLLEPHNHSYNMLVSLDFKREMNQAIFQKAVVALVDKHESLRTTFVLNDGVPAQRITAQANIEVKFEDISGLNQTAQMKKIDQIEREEKSFSFDLEQGPLFKVQVTEVSVNHFIIWMSMHHIISDYWSWQIIVKDLMELYESYEKNNKFPSVKNATVYHYKEYANWQNKRFENGELQGMRTYWLNQLTGELPTLNMPIDYASSVTSNFSASQVDGFIPNAQLEKFKKMSLQHNTSLFVTLLSLYGVLLTRLSQQKDLIIGTPEAGRHQMQFEDVVGFFVNNLILRMNFEGDPSFLDVLKKNRDMTIEAYSNSEYPFNLLVEDLKLERDFNRPTLYNSQFQLIPLEDGLLTDQMNIQLRSTKNYYMDVDLSLLATEVKEGLKLELQYRTDIFNEATVSRWMNYFTHIVEFVLTTPTTKIDHIPLVTGEERDLQLYQWNQTERKNSGRYTAIRRFEEMVEHYPSRIAVEHHQEQFSYQELAQKVDQCASALCAKGMNRGSKVAVSMRNSANLVVSLLAIWKTGAAYVPLDPYFPQERLAYMLADSDAQLLLVDNTTSGTWESHDIPSLNVQTRLASSAMTGGSAIVDRSEPEGLAYILYTSGSTGKPKGVEISHQALSNFLTSMSEEPGMSKEDRLLSVTSISFDISVLELFLPLTTGARVLLVDRETATDGISLSRLIQEKEPTMMQATPSTWQLLLASGWEGSPELKILCGGESWSRELAGQLQARSKELWNMYGPTETTIWSAIHHVREQEGRIPIGRPIANTQMYVLDRGKEPVPIGVAGELYIGGEGVANGYWNRGELTEEKFVDNVFTGKGKMYGTGDLARYNAEGILECLGRIDQQVKIRGYRIELSEIEHQLLQHEAVENAVVVSVQVGEAAQLAAYLVLQPGMSWPGHQAIRQHLQQTLPEYMVPVLYREIEKLPLTPNGKIDRKSLPMIIDLQHDKSYVPPRDLQELKMTKIWEKILKVHPISVTTNFFSIGGHSLKAIQLLHEINAEFGTELRLASLLKEPTIASICALLGGEKQNLASSYLIQLQEGENRSTSPLILIHPQGGGILHYFHLVNSLGTSECIYGIQAPGYESDEEPLDSIEEMAELYVTEIKRKIPTGPYKLIGWSFGGMVAYEMARMFEKMGEKIEFIGLFDVQPLDQSMNIYDEFTEQDAIMYFATLFDLDPLQFDRTDSETALNLLLDEARKREDWPVGMSSKQLKQKMNVLVAAGQAMRKYRYGNPINSDLQLFYVQEVSKHLHKLINPSHWKHRTKGTLSTFLVPGDHNTMALPPHVDELAQMIMTYWNEYSAEGGRETIDIGSQK